MVSEKVREGLAALELQKILIPEFVGKPIDKKALVDMGAILWPFTYKKMKQDSDINRVVQEHIDELSIQDPVAALLLSESFKVPDQQILGLGAARWVDQGLPVIRLGHKRAAAFMATSISEEMLPSIKPPFYAFYIELPDDLLHVTNEHGEKLKAIGVLVHVMNLKGLEEIVGDTMAIATEDAWRWRYAVITGTSLVQWQLNRKLEELAGHVDRGDTWEGMGIPLEDYDRRLSTLVGRLICSTCLMMSNPGDLKERRETTSKTKGGKRPSPGAPDYRVFIEGKPTTVDVRRAVSSYLNGERDTPNVRLLVRGHWKNQAYGPKLSLRKPLHIEPYWKGGAEGDPILKRVYDSSGRTLTKEE